jgi:hypothetical protein
MKICKALKQPWCQYKHRDYLKLIAQYFGNTGARRGGGAQDDSERCVVDRWLGACVWRVAPYTLVLWQSTCEWLWGSIPGEARYFHCAQTGSGAYPASCPVSTGDSSVGSKTVRVWSWPLTSLSSVKVKNAWSCTSTPSYIIKAWCLRRKLYCFFYLQCRRSRLYWGRSFKKKKKILLEADCLREQSVVIWTGPQATDYDVPILALLIVVFWVVMLCGLVGGYQRFGGTYRLHL